MTEIKSTTALPPTSATRPAVAAQDLALKVLQPMQNLLAAGEQIEAEVVSIREAAEAFRLVLRLTMGSGRQATVEVSSNKPAAPGTALVVTALSDTRLLATPQAAGRQPASMIDLQQLPVGSVIQGRVVATSQQRTEDGQTSFKIVVSLLNSPVAGQKLSIESANPLALGSLLTAQVKDSQSLAFLPLSGRLDQLHVGEQLGAQQNRQASLEGLFRALQGAPGALPEGLRGAAEKLLGLIPEMQQLGDAKALAAALARSGVFLEARLLAGHTDGLQGDLKAGLLRLLAQMPNLPGSTPLGGAQAGALSARHCLPSRGKRWARWRRTVRVSSRSAFRCRPGYRPVSRKKPIWKCCSSSLPLPYRGSRPTSFPAWRRHRSGPTALWSPPGSWNCRCGTTATSCHCRSSCSAKTSRNDRKRSAAIRCGRSNWRSTSLRSGRCRFRPN